VNLLQLLIGNERTSESFFQNVRKEEIIQICQSTGKFRELRSKRERERGRENKGVREREREREGERGK